MATRKTIARKTTSNTKKGKLTMNSPKAGFKPGKELKCGGKKY